MTTTGKKARKQFFGKDGGPRAKLRSKSRGAYLRRDAVMGGKSKAAKMAGTGHKRARKEDKHD